LLKKAISFINKAEIALDDLVAMFRMSRAVDLLPKPSGKQGVL
jgi:hypothetical protein